MKRPAHDELDRLIDEAMALSAPVSPPDGFDRRLLVQLRTQAAIQAETRWFRRRAAAAAVAIPAALAAPFVALSLLAPSGEFAGRHGLTDYAASQAEWAWRAVATGAMPAAWVGIGTRPGRPPIALGAL